MRQKVSLAGGRMAGEMECKEGGAERVSGFLEKSQGFSKITESQNLTYHVL